VYRAAGDRSLGTAALERSDQLDQRGGQALATTCKLGTAVLARLDAEARRSGVNRSALMRVIVVAWLDEHGSAPDN
jgi:hypothetical protein